MRSPFFKVAQYLLFVAKKRFKVADCTNLPTTPRNNQFTIIRSTSAEGIDITSCNPIETCWKWYWCDFSSRQSCAPFLPTPHFDTNIVQKSFLFGHAWSFLWANISINILMSITFSHIPHQLSISSFLLPSSHLHFLLHLYLHNIDPHAHHQHNMDMTSLSTSSNMSSICYQIPSILHKHLDFLYFIIPTWYQQ